MKPLVMIVEDDAEIRLALGDLLEATGYAVAQDRLGVRRSIIDRMEREGLVLRERSKEDRRVVYIRLTPKGRELAREIPVEPMEVFKSALETLSQQEMKDLLRIMTKVAKRVRHIVDKEHK